MVKNREYGLDLMRIIASIFIAAFHCGAFLFINAETPDIPAVSLYMIIAVLAKSGVNFFFMTSGAYLLDAERTQDLKAFYGKMWKRLCIPTIVFTLIYFALDLVRTLPAGGNIWACLSTFVRGESGQHMWYMFVLIALYLMAPLVQHLKNKISPKAFTIVAVILVIWGFFGESTSPHVLDWDLGFAVNNLGIFMLGNPLLHHFSEKKRTGKGVLFVILALVLALAHGVLMMLKTGEGIPVLSDLFSIESQSPFLVLIAALLMAGMLAIPFKKDFSKLGALTYGVYLVHPVFVYIGLFVISLIKKVSVGQLVLTIPEFLLLTLVIVVLSFLLAALYYRVFGRKKKQSAQ